MPHLAPMPWLLYMLITWLIMLILMSNMWWLMTKTSKSMNKEVLNSNIKTWKW